MDYYVKWIQNIVTEYNGDETNADTCSTKQTLKETIAQIRRIKRTGYYGWKLPVSEFSFDGRKLTIKLQKSGISNGQFVCATYTAEITTDDGSRFIAPSVWSNADAFAIVQAVN